MKTTTKALAKQVTTLRRLELALDDAIAACSDREEQAVLREQLRATIDLRQCAERKIAILKDPDRTMPQCAINHRAMMSG